MSFKVVYEFHSSETKAKQALKKIPSIFHNPHIEDAGDGKFAVVAGEYDSRKIAEMATHKLYECKLHGGIWIV